MKLPLIKGTRTDLDAEWRDALPLNMVGFVQDSAGSPGFLRTLDGLEAFATGQGIDRGGYWSDNFQTHVRISGNKIIELDQFGNVTVDADIDNDLGGNEQIKFASSFNSIAFIADGNYQRYLPNDPPGAKLQDRSRPGGADPLIDLTWIDGFYIFTDGTNLYNTDILAEQNFDATFAGSDFAPDKIVGLEKTTDNKLMVFNRYTTERFYNDPNRTSFPFSRITNAAIPIGIVGPRAKANIGDGRFFVFGGSKEKSPSFYILTNSYTNVATREIDSIIDTYSDEDLESMLIEYRDTRDQQLIICHLPNDVLVYDYTFSQRSGQNIWYRWKSGGETYRAINGVYDPRTVSSAASAWIYGDKQDTTIGKLNRTLCTQYGADLQWECYTPIVKVGRTINEMEVDTIAGTNTTASPSIFVSTTKDGFAYGPEKIISTGGQGNYTQRVIARRLGYYPHYFGLKLRGFSSDVTTLSGCELR